jgi:hypothetical protein
MAPCFFIAPLKSSIVLAAPQTLEICPSGKKICLKEGRQASRRLPDSIPGTAGELLARFYEQSSVDYLYFVAHVTPLPQSKDLGRLMDV